MEHLTSFVDIMLIKNSFLKFKEMELKLFWSCCKSKRILVEYSMAIIHTFLNEFNGEDIKKYLS